MIFIRVHCFHVSTDIMLILLLKDLSILCVLNKWWLIILHSLLSLLSTFLVHWYQQCITEYHMPKYMSYSKPVTVNGAFMTSTWRVRVGSEKKRVKILPVLRHAKLYYLITLRSPRYQGSLSSFLQCKSCKYQSVKKYSLTVLRFQF